MLHCYKKTLTKLYTLLRRFNHNTVLLFKATIESITHRNIYSLNRPEAICNARVKVSNFIIELLFTEG